MNWEVGTLYMTENDLDLIGSGLDRHQSQTVL